MWCPNNLRYVHEFLGNSRIGLFNHSLHRPDRPVLWQEVSIYPVLSPTFPDAEARIFSSFAKPGDGVWCSGPNAIYALVSNGGVAHGLAMLDLAVALFRLVSCSHSRLGLGGWWCSYCCSSLVG